MLVAVGRVDGHKTVVVQVDGHTTVGGHKTAAVQVDGHKTAAVDNFVAVCIEMHPRNFHRRFDVSAVKITININIF